MPGLFLVQYLLAKAWIFQRCLCFRRGHCDGHLGSELHPAHLAGRSRFSWVIQVSALKDLFCQVQILLLFDGLLRFPWFA